MASSESGGWVAELRTRGVGRYSCKSKLSLSCVAYTPAGAAESLYSSSSTVGWMEGGHDEGPHTDREDSSGAVQSAVDYLLDSVPEGGTDAVADLLKELDMTAAGSPGIL